jgi:hypothetical protein
MADPRLLQQLRLPLRSEVEAASDLEVQVPRVVEDDLERLHRYLSDALCEPIDLVGTKNRRNLISLRRTESGILQVRVQEQFAIGGPVVSTALARWIRGKEPEARAVLKRYAETFQSLMRPPRPRFAHPAGIHHDLREHLAGQNRRWFGGRFNGRIGWSRMNRGQVRRRIRLGSWSEQHRLIRIHPALDSSEVPDFVLGFVVFHEMLHAMLGFEERGARRSVHGAKFRELEVSHPDHDRAEEWIERMSDSLLSF